MRVPVRITSTERLSLGVKYIITILSGMDAASIVHTNNLTAMQNLNSRADRYGNFVRVMVVFGMYSPLPKTGTFLGDTKGRLPKTKEATHENGPFRSWCGSPG